MPEHPGPNRAALDVAVVGPLALLRDLELMLGLGGPEVSAVERIAIYRRKIESAGANRFWSESFALDPWPSTRELLGWRDELIEAGWRPSIGTDRHRLRDSRRRKRSAPHCLLGIPIVCVPSSMNFAITRPILCNQSSSSMRAIFFLPDGVHGDLASSSKRTLAASPLAAVGESDLPANRGFV